MMKPYIIIGYMFIDTLTTLSILHIVAYLSVMGLVLGVLNSIRCLITIGYLVLEEIS